MERLDVELKGPPIVSELSGSFARRLLRFRVSLVKDRERLYPSTMDHSHLRALLMMTS
jgi:hypothetical protein